MSAKATVEQVQTLGSSLTSDVESAKSALALLAKLEWEATTAGVFKAGGHLSHALKWMDPQHPSSMRSASALLVSNLIGVDPTCKLDAIQAGLTRRVCAALDDPDIELVGASLNLMLVCVRELDDRMRKEAFEEMFRLSGIAKAVSLLNPNRQPHELAVQSARLLGWVTALTAFHDRIRDTGIVPRVVDLAAVSPQPKFFLCNLNNLARSESLHLCIQAAGAKDKLKDLLEKTQEEVIRTLLLIIMAHVYSSAEDSEVDSLLSKFNVAGSLLAALRACVTSNGWYAGLIWSVDAVAQAIQNIARNPRYASELVNEGSGQLLVQALTADSSAPQDNETSVAICRALLVLASHPETHQMLQACGTIEALTRCVHSPDLRVADAARGALLQMGALQDEAAEAANAMATAPLHTHNYDVFLSHKRTDSKDFARALYNLLVLRGFSTFLDCEYREELENLEAIVASCANFIFILTDNVFESKWCMKELSAAVNAGVNIILVTKEGSRWKDSSGAMVCEFPPYSLIEALPEAIRPVFSRKALSHSDEYYQAFVDMLLQKLKTQGPGQQGLQMPSLPAPAVSRGSNSSIGAMPSQGPYSRGSASQLVPFLNHSYTLTPNLSQAPPVSRGSVYTLPPPVRSTLLNNGDAFQGLQSNDVADLSRSITEGVGARLRTLMTAQVAGLKGELVAEVAGLCGDLGANMHYMGDGIRQDMRAMVEAINSLASSVNQLNVTMASLEARMAPQPAMTPYSSSFMEGQQESRGRVSRGVAPQNHSIAHQSSSPYGFTTSQVVAAYASHGSHHAAQVQHMMSSAPLSTTYAQQKGRHAFQKECTTSVPSAFPAPEPQHYGRGSHGQIPTSVAPTVTLRRISSENDVFGNPENPQSQTNGSASSPSAQPTNTTVRKPEPKGQPLKKKNGGAPVPRELPVVPGKH